jgi:hypothetical protein
MECRVKAIDHVAQTNCQADVNDLLSTEMLLKALERGPKLPGRFSITSTRGKPGNGRVQRAERSCG